MKDEIILLKERIDLIWSYVVRIQVMNSEMKKFGDALKTGISASILKSPNSSNFSCVGFNKHETKLWILFFWIESVRSKVSLESELKG